jgi:enterochelin esterase-like enzyme
MDYHVILPPCYAEQTEKHYPVLYLLHGQNATQDQWLRLGIAEAAERLMLAGDIPPFLIVLPFDHSYKQPREYRFEEVFLEQLIPTIDQGYRTLAKRDSRAIGGLSRGGAWSIYITSRHPEYFSVVGAHSPAVFYSNTSALPVRLRDIPPEQRPIFYIDAGDKDIEFREIQKFTNLLNDLGIPHEWHYNLGAHDEKYWSSHVEEYLRWYADQLPPSP